MSIYSDLKDVPEVDENNTKTMAQSKVKSVKPLEPWTHQQYGKMFPFWYIFEDGVEGTANHKAENGAFQPGTEVEYEVQSEHPQHGKKLKVTKPQDAPGTPFQGKKRDPEAEALKQRMIIAQSSQAHAVSLYPYIYGGLSESSRKSADTVEGEIKALTQILYNQVIEISK